jgi:hypothetical protein
VDKRLDAIEALKDITPARVSTADYIDKRGKPASPDPISYPGYPISIGCSECLANNSQHHYPDLQQLIYFQCLEALMVSNESDYEIVMLIMLHPMTPRFLEIRCNIQPKVILSPTMRFSRGNNWVPLLLRRYIVC